MSIQRVIHFEEADAVAAVEVFKKTITTELESRLNARKKLAEQLAIFRAPQKAQVKADPKTESALNELKSLIEEERLRFKKKVTASQVQTVKDFNFTITGNQGLFLITPPYDMEWKLNPSNLLCTADRNAGTFSAACIDSLGTQAAGLGVFLTSTIAHDVRLSPEALFHSTWLDFVIQGNAFSDGGFGLIVYQLPDTQIARVEVDLWSDLQFGNGAPHWAQDDSSTFLSQTPAGDTFFHMLAFERYLAWVYCWTTTHTFGSAVAAVSSIQAQMPFIVLELQR